MQHSKDNHIAVPSKDYPPAPHSQAKPTTHRPAKRTNVANSARGETIYRVEHSFRSSNGRFCMSLLARPA